MLVTFAIDIVMGVFFLNTTPFTVNNFCAEALRPRQKQKNIIAPSLLYGDGLFNMQN
jgi:hypothetical protein